MKNHSLLNSLSRKLDQCTLGNPGSIGKQIHKLLIVCTCLLFFVVPPAIALNALRHFFFDEPYSSMHLNLTVINKSSHPIKTAGLDPQYDQDAESSGPLQPNASKQIHTHVDEEYRPRQVRVETSAGMLSGRIPNVERLMPVDYRVDCTLEVWPNHVTLTSTNSLYGSATVDIVLGPYVDPFAPPTPDSPESPAP